MKYSEAKQGRIFILRLEQGDIIPETLEDFAYRQKIDSALVFFLGGAEQGSKVITGPEAGTEKNPVPNLTFLEGVSEAVGVGTIFLSAEGNPSLHLHSAFGRQEQTVTGCTRKGVEIWNIGEVIIMEILDSQATRKIDPETGFELLHVEES